MNARGGGLLATVCVLFLVACGAGIAESTILSETPTYTNSAAGGVPTPVLIDIDSIPDADLSRHSVPLEEIYFDTFRNINRAVPLTKADPALIRSLRDAIPPIYQPVFETTAVANAWLAPQDYVLGYADENEAYAYPVKILNFHEIVSHTVNGRPILATYCPLCLSGVVYDRTVEGDVLLFGNTSALYESDMVMLDHQTGSYWVQVSGRAVVGRLTGAKLEALPSQMSTWKQWRALYPDTLVLSRDTGFSRNYARDPFAGYPEQLNVTGRFAFPVSEAGRDPRLAPGAIVLGVQINEETHAYPVENIDLETINEAVGDQNAAIFIHPELAAAYRSVVNGRSLTFSVQDGQIMDNQTNSTWNLAGEAVGGELSGARLEPLPTRTSLWFSLIAAFPDLILHQP